MQGRQIQLITVVSIGLFISWLSVGLRCYTRLFVSRTFGSDDCWMILALIGYTITSAIGYVGIVQFGIGAHASQLDYYQFTGGLKYQVILELAYILDTAVIKTSIGLLLLRITSVKLLYKCIIWGSLTVIWIWTIVTFIIGCLQCRPLRAMWDALIPGRCFDTSIITNFAYAISAETIFFDWIFALLPIPMLWNIKMTSQLKVSIVLILGVGIIASSATIVRLKYLLAFEALADSLYAISPVFLWSTIELALAITAGSVATLRPLLRSWHILGFTENSADPSYDPGRPRSRSGYKEQSSKDQPNMRDGLDISRALYSREDNIEFSDLQTRPSLSGKSDQEMLGRNGNCHGVPGGTRDGNYSDGSDERDINVYGLKSHQNGSIMKRTEFQVDYAESVWQINKDMV